jgi:hypothetical protein
MSTKHRIPVSVLIPTRNEERNVAGVLRQKESPPIPSRMGQLEGSVVRLDGWNRSDLLGKAIDFSWCRFVPE